MSPLAAQQRNNPPAKGAPSNTAKAPAQGSIKQGPVKQASAQATPSNGLATKPGTPSVVAVVNNVPIARDTLAQECIARFGEPVLENLLNKSLILQACEAQKIVITEKDVDAEIGRIALKFNLSTKLYLQLLEEERGIKPAQYASDVVWQMMALRALARDKIQVDQKEIDAAYEREYGPTVKVRMIAMSDLKRATEIHKQALADPSSFKRLAKQYSEDPDTAAVEGLCPPIHKSSGDQIESLAFQLQQDEISKVITIGNMHLFLQCVRHEAATPPSQDQMQAVLLRIRQGIEDEKLKEMADKIFGTLQEHSNVVKIYGNPELEKQNPGVAAFINRQPLMLQTLQDECISRHGELVLEGEIHRKIMEEALKAKNLQVTQIDIDQEIARAAVYFGFVNADRSPNVDAWLKSVVEQQGKKLDLYVRDEVWPSVALKKMVDGTVKLTQEDIKKGFESNYGPRAEVLAIVLSNHRKAQEVWQMARGNPTEQFFGELAAEFSVEPTSRSNYGKVQPIRKNGPQPTLEKVAFGLKPNELSGIIEVNQQYVILRSQGFTDPVVKNFEEVRDILEKELIEKKTRVAMQDEMDRLMKDAVIDNFKYPTKSQVGSQVTEAIKSASKDADPKAPVRK